MYNAPISSSAAPVSLTMGQFIYCALALTNKTPQTLTRGILRALATHFSFEPNEQTFHTIILLHNKISNYLRFFIRPSSFCQIISTKILNSRMIGGHTHMDIKLLYKAGFEASIEQFTIIYNRHSLRIDYSALIQAKTAGNPLARLRLFLFLSLAHLRTEPKNLTEKAINDYVPICSKSSGVAAYSIPYLRGTYQAHRAIFNDLCQIINPIDLTKIQSYQIIDIYLKNNTYFADIVLDFERADLIHYYKFTVRFDADDTPRMLCKGLQTHPRAFNFRALTSYRNKCCIMAIAGVINEQVIHTINDTFIAGLNSREFKAHQELRAIFNEPEQRITRQQVAELIFALRFVLLERRVDLFWPESSLAHR